MLKVVVIAALLWGLPAVLPAQNSAGLAEKQVKKAIEMRRQTQEQEDAWAAGKARLEAEYDALEAENTQLEKFVTELELRVAHQKTAIGDMQAQFDQIKRVSAELLPYLKQLVERLQRQIERDLPFLASPRRLRVQLLGEKLEDEKISIGQKFQSVMDTLMAEAAYGTSVEVYPQKILLEEQPVLVDVLRLGRLSLFCQTPDRRTSGYYNPAREMWQPLSSNFNAEIQAAIEIASKQRSVELLALPLGKVVTP